MTSVEYKLAKSLTAETTELIPYLPYLLQDIWELGSIPTDISGLLSEYTSISASSRILDLACGKGAVSIFLAKALGCQVKGIDLLDDFIAVAKNQAKGLNLSNLCRFAVGDINEAINTEKGYDVVILGAAGDVLGTPVETIVKLKKTVKSKGFIVIDDAYVEPNSTIDYYTREHWMGCFQKAGVRLLGEKGCDPKQMSRINQHNQANIVKRAKELTARYPEKADLFAGYVKSQQAECDDLEGELTAVTWLLQAND